MQRPGGIFWDRPASMMLTAELLFVLASILIVYGLIHMVIRLPIFPLQKVQITTPLDHVTREQIETIVKVELKGNLFTIDLEEVSSAFRTLPWVRKVSVRRQWPDRLVVNIEEHKALARWGGTALVNTFGEVFHAASDAALPIFTGPAGKSDEVAKIYEKYRERLGLIGRIPVQVHLSDRRAWQIRLDDDMVIELGRHDIDQRLQRFISMYSSTILRLPHRVDYVDLRYGNGFAVRIPGFDLNKIQNKQGYKQPTIQPPVSNKGKSEASKRPNGLALACCTSLSNIQWMATS